ncbi:hypothetical protein K450DRAFT_223748 [Umbelopsis ramanniana AG]|uniref:Uracil-DNA glycosylase n=1 Tax=Umbelopsis ramanniana AG TaxID=1314678 RepID=A0AAD5EHJ1_UMBRA|nr:uncharacterized protein K450DRAFT_223748 [Umbelopsis ramanniana AG]KAI8583452.1 hypothetical protein K450DRAFT_223748 [Umbelopsis ramanniana AG]
MESSKRKISQVDGTAGSVDKENKKKTTASPARQSSLLSMWGAKSTTDKAVSSLAVAKAAPINKSDLEKDLTEEQKTLLKLELETLNPEWLRILKPELTKPSFLKLKSFLENEKKQGNKIFPPENDIYSWSNFTPASKVKVVILGQDPYHGDGQAHGLCFSVKKGVRVPPSLVNIYTCVKNDYPDFNKPNHGYLENWAKEGVLLLNTSLTVKAHEAASHANKGWEELTDAVINYVNEKKSGVVFMLWGAHAQKKGAKINKSKHLVLKAVHPSPLSAHRGFLQCNHFATANKYLRDNAKDEINWNCLT